MLKQCPLLKGIKSTLIIRLKSFVEGVYVPKPKPKSMDEIISDEKKECKLTISGGGG